MTQSACNHREPKTGKYLLLSAHDTRGEYVYCRRCTKVWEDPSDELEDCRQQLATECEAKHQAREVLHLATGFAQYIRDHSSGDAQFMAKNLLKEIKNLPHLSQ